MFKRWFWTGFLTGLAFINLLMVLEIQGREYRPTGRLIYADEWIFNNYRDLETVISVLFFCFWAGILAYCIRKVCDFATQKK